MALLFWIIQTIWLRHVKVFLNTKHAFQILKKLLTFILEKQNTCSNIATAREFERHE